MEKTDYVSSYPFFNIARNCGVSYAEVLAIADRMWEVEDGVVSTSRAFLNSIICDAVMTERQRRLNCG